MLINSVSYKVIKYELMTDFSFKFKKSDTGKYFVSSDRSSNNDVYKSKITLYGEYDYIWQFQELQESFRSSSFFQFTAEGNEKVFGADIDYTTTTYMVVESFTDVLQNTLNGYSFEFTARWLQNSFIGTSTFPELRHGNNKINANSDFTKEIKNTYIETSSTGWRDVVDNYKDYGYFEGVYYFNDSDMANLKRFYATKRGDSFYIYSIPGIVYPFGKRKKTVFPVKVKLIYIKEKYMSPNRWECVIRLVED